MEFASDLAREAGALTLKYYQRELKVDQKADGSPVTVADRESEDLIRKRIKENYPGDAVHGSERRDRPRHS